MRNLLHYSVLSSALLVSAILCCTPSGPLTGGSSSETVVGKVVNGDGSPACSTIVTLYPADYDPVADAASGGATTDTTDSRGSYSIPAPDSTIDYSIVATSPAAGTRAFVGSFAVNGDTTRAQDAVLAEPGAICVAVPDSAASAHGYVYIPGTDIAVFVNGGSMVLLEQVPAGTIPSVNYASTAASGVASVITSNIVVASDNTAVIPYPQWRHSAKLYLNTTASGAGVSGKVNNFPVLVRLTGSKFDFSQVQTDGTDVRFTGADGAHLPYEIERWDPVAELAEVWVRVPVVLGDNDKQYIVMHWGAPTPSTPSTGSGAAVFDTAAGFQAVWHLSGAGNSTVFDATANRLDGTPYSMTITSAVAGAIGTARDFDGTAGYIAIPNSASSDLDMPQNGNYSISLWAYADTIDTLWHEIAGKGHEQYYLKLKCFNTGKATWEFVEFQDAKGWQFTEDSIPPAPGAKQWVYLTGVRAGSKQYLFINGELVNDTVLLMSGDYPRNTGDNFTIGRHARKVTIPYGEGWGYFNGKIDEVRVMNGVPGPDWIRLCYMNQKAEDALVEFR